MKGSDSKRKHSVRNCDHATINGGIVSVTVQNVQYRCGCEDATFMEERG